MGIEVYKIVLVALIAELVVFTSAHASDYSYGIPNYTATSVIDSNVAIGANGNIAINQAAGDANVQSNSGAISINPTGAASTLVSSRQQTATGQANSPEISIARISDNAFSNASGVISINQISGTGNAQANGFAFSFGLVGEVLTEGVLAQTISDAVNGSAIQQQTDINTRLLDVDATAFDNSHGIVQLNQSVGTGNATSNNFALRFSLGAN